MNQVAKTEMHSVPFQMFCLDWVPSLTIGLETGFQNFALALIMLEVCMFVQTLSDFKMIHFDEDLNS